MQGKAFCLHLKTEHVVLSTSPVLGGFQDQVRHVINLQTCEGRHHDDIAKEPLHQRSEKDHFEETAKSLGLDPGQCVYMGTAANMNYAMLGKATFQDLEVHAFATAGVQSNATRAGDEAKYYEDTGVWKPCAAPEGTINIILHINQPLSLSAVSRAVVTMTEAKTAVLMDLGVGSRSSQALATGTGTDQFIICVVQDPAQIPLTGSGSHTKLGECIGKAVYNAVREALEWQNGFDSKRCRSLYHQLKRFGLKEENWLEWLSPWLKPNEQKFFEANRLAIEHDLMVSNCVATLCQLMDRQRCGHITEDAMVEHARSSCALMISQLAHDDEQFSESKRELGDENQIFAILAKSLVLGWRAKWS